MFLCVKIYWNAYKYVLSKQLNVWILWNVYWEGITMVYHQFLTLIHSINYQDTSQNQMTSEYHQNIPLLCLQNVIKQLSFRANSWMSSIYIVLELLLHCIL